MNSPTSFTRTLGFRFKKVQAQNPSLTPHIHDLHATMTPKYNKTLSSPLLNGWPSCASPENYGKSDSYRRGSYSPLPEDIDLPNSKKVLKLHRRSVKNLDIISENQSPKIQDNLELKLMSSLRRENKTPQSFSPKVLANISSFTPRNQSSSKKKMLASIVGNKPNGFVVSPAGQILKRLPLKDEDFCDSSARIQFQDIPNAHSYKSQPPSPQNQQIKGLNRSLDCQEENGRSSPVVMSQILYAPYTPKGSSTTTSKGKTPVNLFSLKNKGLKSFEEVKGRKNLLVSKDASDIANDVNCSIMPDIKEISQSKIRLKFPESHRERSCIEIGKHCGRLDRKGKRIGESLSPDSQYNYLDCQNRYNASRVNKGHELMFDKRKYKGDELECWVNTAVKYGLESQILTKKGEKLRQRNIPRKKKDNVIKDIFTVKNWCKEVINFGQFADAK